MLPYLSTLSAILPIVFFLAFYKRNKKGELWVIFTYTITSFATDLSYKRLVHNLNVPPLYIYTFFSLLEYSLFALFLYKSYKQRSFKNILLLLSLIFYAVALVNLFHNNSDSQSFDSPSASLESILIIVYCIFFLFEQVKDPNIFYIYYIKKFWVVLALLIYFASTLFLFLYAATFEKPELSTYWKINYIFDIIKNLLFVVSFTMKDNKQAYSADTLYNDI